MTEQHETAGRWVETDATGDHDDLAGPHGVTDHGSSDGHDDHAHRSEDEPLGPIDWTAWGLGALGVLVGLTMAVLLAASTSTL